MPNKILSARSRFREYIYDPSVDIKDRAFLVFSTVVLIALFLAIPCGLIMQEPLTATISTLVGTLFFTAYVVWAVKRKRIATARILISIILVFIFLPAMFFTNGGVYGGTPIWLLLGTIYITMILDGWLKALMLVLNVIVIIACWIVGYLCPDLITEYNRGQDFFDTLAGLIIVGAIIYMLMTFQRNLFRRDEEQKNLRRLFEQTATALVNAIDAKDEYTHGHSARVAEYSKRIAELAGMSKSECEEIYYVALLHDVGKIGVPESIINKNGRLTEEEFEQIKQHPVLGAQILHSITEYPNLSIGAQYHHERYDGKGYPDKLKGEDIPKFARIISVADAYDAMTSKRSYRDAIPQQTVREEIVKGAGTQFDPEYAKIMQHLIDLDTEYELKEKGEVKELAGKTELSCERFGSEISDGILVDREIRHISFRCRTLKNKENAGMPGILLFDSLDGRIHDDERDIKEMCYFVYAEIHFDGRFECLGARKIKVEEKPSRRKEREEREKKAAFYEVESVKYRDHILLKVDNGVKSIEFTVALPDSTRYAYAGLTGEYCRLFDVSIEKTDGEIGEGYIPRIAEEVSFIDGPTGDIPSIQIDGYRAAQTEGIPVTDGMQISFHTKSLPTARLVWHTAYLDLFYSDDRRPEGESYREFALIRLDGENWEAAGVADNRLTVNKGDDFDGWESWKEANKKGFDCTVTLHRLDNKIVTLTENMGISIRNTTTILDGTTDVYVALTGDQCVLTNIRIKKNADAIKS